MNPGDLMIGAAIGAGTAVLVVLARLLLIAVSRRRTRALDERTERMTGESGR